MCRLALLALVAVACNAASLPSGQQPTDSNTKKTESSPQDWASCTVGDQTLKPGQRAVNGNFTFECLQDTNGIVRTSIVACLDENKNEHPIGDRWETGKRPFRFTLECSKTDSITTRRVAQCFYDSDEGQARLDANQEKQVGKNLVRCEPFGNGGLRYTVKWGQSNPTAAAPTTGSNTVASNPSTDTKTNTNTGTATTNNNSNTNTGNTIASTSNPNTDTKTNSGTTTGSPLPSSVPVVQRSEPLPSSSSNANANANVNTNTNTQVTRSDPTCTLHGKELKVGQRGQSGSFIYECQRMDGNMVRNAIVACMDDNKPQGDHPHGEQWVEGDSPFRYVFECAKNGDETVKRAIKCAYVSKDGREVKIDTGREETVDNFVVKCDRMGSNGVQYHISYTQTYLASLNANVTSTSTGNNPKGQMH